MSESLVGFGHLVGIFALLNRVTDVVDCIQNLTGETILHGLLGTVAGIATGYVLFSALLIFNVEPESFDRFFDAVYWATVSLTTVGYGDIYPTSTLGRIVTMISSIFGIAIVALPAGILTAGFMEALNNKESSKEIQNEIRDEETIVEEVNQGPNNGETQKKS